MSGNHLVKQVFPLMIEYSYLLFVVPRILMCSVTPNLHKHVVEKTLNQPSHFVEREN